MNAVARIDQNLPEIKIDVVESGGLARKGRTKLDLGRDVKFSTEGLESYAFTNWEPVMYDALVLAAAIEYGDKIIKRPPTGWARRIFIRIPVHNPERWSAPAVITSLLDSLEFLTGDYWVLEFVCRSTRAPSPPHDYLFKLPVNPQAVLAYSDGMDSRAVAEILGENLVRVRVGTIKRDKPKYEATRRPFTSVPYSVACNNRNRESSARSRGFKFSLITAIAAYLTNTEEIVIPESGQGAIGPALVTVGHGYPDYRNHPLFARRMEKFINALFGTQIRFVFPRIWYTKGETLREMVSVSERSDWQTTRSCWQGNNWCSIGGKLRQCGICAACMLRRVSVHAAGLMEKPDIYVTTDMKANTLKEAIDKEFTRWRPSFREYAIAGILHMDHLADMAEAGASRIVKRHATLIAPALDLSREVAENKLKTLLCRHAKEWREYLDSLGAHSFVKQWVRTDK